MTLDINSDLGENEPRSRTRALMRLVTSANIACGGHAGSAESMEACVRMAKEHGAHIGAHPGFADAAGFGRSARSVERDELARLLLHQVGGLEAVVRANGAELHHIKLHGALYHAVESRTALARTYVEIVKRYWPGVRLYAFAGGAVQAAAKKLGLPVSGEAFAERGYLDSGALVRRGHPKALVTDLREIGERVRHLLMFGEIPSIKGNAVRIAADTICVHSDSPNAVQIARLLREKLES